ncbi:E3 ubiquitin-protein ligase makorin-1-like [Moesziomyces antarcticus]|uniref:Related to makorin ring zinc finger protein n=1 Tax=Pseudozyma antarctica TaxID=84753 RepID=A0A5C3FH24_PSEA2|nr:E3 ubiquitin-protein ligase makorin-1-like [Moesziomyces antarcticus]GAK62860.1 E3 ubiquitin-protein ligase makorin-1-like [Moesziomyces antarcticus]SPO43668.1 related to makorin ring zinc finger protein [Moesziomyces antarcticus]
MQETAPSTSGSAASKTAKSSKPCRYYSRSGKCRRGNKCLFSHEQARPSEQSVIPSPTAPAACSVRLSAEAPEYTPNTNTSKPLSARAPEFEPHACKHDEEWVDVAAPEPASSETTEEWEDVAGSNSLPTETTALSTVESVAPTPQPETTAEPQTCGVCFEVLKVFAQHPNCDHYFCPTCMREWRGQGDQDNRKKCPLCRVGSKYTFVTGQPFQGSARILAVQRFRERAAATPCKAFTRSLSLSKNRNKPFCAFADDCLFQHHIDGKPHTFGYGRLAVRKKIRKRTRRLVRPVARSESSMRPEFLQRVRDIDQRILLLLAARQAA